MRFASFPLCALPLTLVLACGGSEKPPAESPETAGTVEQPDQPPSGSNVPSDEAIGEDWEGESDAKDTGAAAAEPGGAAPADPKGEETRTIEVISKLVKDHRKPVRECYEKARKDIPDLKGDMVIHFVLDPEGKVKKAELNVERSTLKSPAVADCAIQVIRGIKFPASSRGMDTTVNYPFNLNP